MATNDSPSSVLKSVQGLSGTRRIVLLGAVVAAVVGIWFVSQWASAPTYVSLFRDLELNEAGAIGEHLAKTDIPHKLGAGGTEVLVPAEDVARARVALAKDGLPSNGRPGLELFDKPSWGMTDFAQRVTYQRALEGELARTIGGLRGVDKAQVHLVLPVQSPLRRLEHAAGASIVLTLKSGATLTPEAVQGITYIVSNSVERLSAENVAVMDDAGHMLSVPSPVGSVAGATSRQMDLQRATEQHLAQKVEDLLATVVGSGHARAEVSALLSFEQVDRTTESFDPDGQVLQNEQRSEGGAPAEPAAAQTIVNNTYQNTRKVEKATGSVGNLARLTVAVLVDEKSMAGTTDRPRLELAAIESMVRNAVGADSARGDRVTVLAVPFEPSIVSANAAAAGFEAPKMDFVVVAQRVSRPIVGIAAIVVLLIVALRVLKPAGGSPAAAPIDAGRAPIGDLATLRARGTNGAANGAEGADATAQVVRAWLAETR